MKIMLGLVYKIVLAALFAKWMEAVAYGETWYAGIGYVYCYGFNMFFDFAGYSLMAVGTSYILGVKAPDNFGFRFISKDIKEFGTDGIYRCRIGSGILYSQDLL